MRQHPQLGEELALWRRERRMLPVWWRDDDAVAPSPALDRLIALAARAGAPLHLAVIPDGATAALADRLASADGVFALVHGWAHANHAPADAKKAEFGAHRPLPERMREAENGRRIVENLFGQAFLPVFVPPWNRVAADLPAALTASGFRALSCFGSRVAPLCAPGLTEINAHLDPIDWHDGRSLVDPERLMSQLAVDLAARRLGRVDASEPYGLLTHHLVHDETVWSFLADITDLLGDSGVARWVAPFADL